MDSISVQQAMDQLKQIIQIANEDKQQFRITSEAGNVIVIPEETYENILVTLELLSTPGLMENIDFHNSFEREDSISQASNQ